MISRISLGTQLLLLLVVSHILTIFFYTSSTNLLKNIHNPTIPNTNVTRIAVGDTSAIWIDIGNKCILCNNPCGMSGFVTQYIALNTRAVQNIYKHPCTIMFFFTYLSYSLLIISPMNVMIEVIMIKNILLPFIFILLYLVCIKELSYNLLQ